jgi:tetratricopeptide (TPR) repeat protein
MSKQNTLTIDQALDLAIEHHSAGNFPTAQAIYQQILQAVPKHPDALHLLGVIAHQEGKNDIAVDLIAKSLNVRHGHAEAHSNLGLAYQALGRLDEAVASHRKALTIKADSPETHNNLGNALQDLARFDEAISSYHKALVIKPENSQAYEKQLAGDSLIGILCHHRPKAGTRGAYVEAQEELQRLTPKIQPGTEIDDDIVRHLYRKCRDILKNHGLGDYEYPETQAWQGKVIHSDCEHYRTLFNTFDIIPEYCFGCFKVQVEPRTVVELFKLMLVFDVLEFPRANSRKCMVELRPETSGSYKGLIYCYDLEDAQEILTYVQLMVGKLVSRDIPILIKRGCSEYPVAYPEYGRFQDDGTPVMNYDEAWSEYENKLEKILLKDSDSRLKPRLAGFTVRDVLVMRNWLRYAATIGDPGSLWISGFPEDHLQMEKRSPFQTVGDN